MGATPAATPSTSPAVPMVIPLDVVLHVPPASVFVSMTVAPWHTDEGPPMGGGVAPTVTTAVAAQPLSV
jgi:hypothetical protein